MKRLAALGLISAVALAGCSSGDDKHDAGPTKSVTAPSFSVGPPAEVKGVNESEQPPRPSSTYSPRAGANTLSSAPAPSSVNRGNIDAVAQAWISTVSTPDASKDSARADAYKRARYLAGDIEASQIDNDGDLVSQVPDSVWNQAKAHGAKATAYASGHTSPVPDEGNVKYRCFMVDRVWTANNFTLAEPQFTECIRLESADGKWSVTSDSILPSSGD